MPGDFSRPVPIRLAYRYPNGSMVGYAARAVSYNGTSLRLIVNESFEEGMSLAVMAPFLGGLTTALVSAASRSKKQPGYYEIVLRLGKANGTTVAAPSEGQEQADPAERGAGRKQPARMVPEAIAQAAEELANALYRLPAPRFSQALQWTPAKSRSLALLAAVAAAVHLLEEKGFVNSTHLFRPVKGAHNR